MDGQPILLLFHLWIVQISKCHQKKVNNRPIANAAYGINISHVNSTFQLCSKPAIPWAQHLYFYWNQWAQSVLHDNKLINNRVGLANKSLGLGLCSGKTIWLIYTYTFPSPVFESFFKMLRYNLIILYSRKWWVRSLQCFLL